VSTVLHIGWNVGGLSFAKEIIADTDALFVVRPITSTLWFVFFFASFTDRLGDCRRTKDGGATWAILASPATNHDWSDIRAAADGRLWGITVDSTDQDKSQVWYSDDDGDSWISSNSRDVVNERRQMVAPHPTDNQRVAVIGVDAVTIERLRVSLTTDRGATWSHVSAENVMWAALAHEFDVRMHVNNRLIIPVLLDTSSSPGIITSDDDGVTWVVRKNFGGNLNFRRTLGPAGNLIGGRLFVVFTDAAGSPSLNEIWTSIDGGLTWNLLSTLPNSPDVDYEGIAFDENKDALYVAGGTLGQTNLIMRLMPANSSGTWLDVTHDFADTISLRLDPHQSASIAVIP
jgi:hypothetical protein